MRTRPSASLARWGLLATTLVMATTLVATGIAGYRSAEEASRSIVRARSRDHTMALRRAMHHADGDRQQRLLTAFDEVRDQGVRAVALVGRRGRVVARAGVALDEAEIMEFIAGGTGRHEPVWVGDRARVVVSGGPPARARRPGARRGRRGRGPALLYLEFEPVVAQEVRDQAFRTLVIGSLAAALLLLVGLVFWRLSLRAQRAEAGLAHERRLAALGEMSAVLGHELKNPLAALKGHAQLLLERVPEDAGFLRTSAETVVRETVRLQRLTEQVLAFVRTGDVDRVEADPTGVAQRAIETLEERGVVTLRASTAPARWRLDPARIQQVLTNLLRNATTYALTRRCNIVRLPVLTHGSLRQARVVRPCCITCTHMVGMVVTTAPQ